jgi:type II secretory ATPase GspE/PulE/Tfp pilus assembly ATPase PilB-like protein
MLGLRTAYGAAILLALAGALGLVSHQRAWAQAGLADVLETQAIGNELEGGTRSNRGNNPSPQQDAPQASNPAASARPQDDAGRFLAELKQISLNVANLLKLAAMFVILWMWVAAADWVNRDALIFHLGYFKWNAIIFFPFMAIAFLLVFMPLGTVYRAPILWVVFVGTWIPYVVVHNKHVQPHQTVLTGSWWRYVFASLASRVGVKVSAERKAEYEKGAAVELFAIGAEDLTINNANLLSARNSPGYLILKDLIADLAERRSERVLLDFTQQAVNVRHEIDGVWHNGEARDRESSDVMLAVMKTLANLEVKERRKKQAGKFGAKFDGHTYLCPLSSQGVATGERVVMSLRGEQQRFGSYADLGMREGLHRQWAEFMAGEQGILVFSALPEGGLTTLINVSLEETDRLMRDFVAIEEVNHLEMEIQNIAVHTYDASAGETPAMLMPKLIRLYPNVYICRDLVDGASAKLLFNEVKDDRLVVTSVPAKEAAEALLRILQLKVPVQEFAAGVKAVLYERLIRKLCPDCKVGYTPPPDVLQKLGIPAGKVEKLYRPPKPEEIEKPCRTCQGLGYRGRTGVFELLVINDQMREILVKQPKVDLLKKAARAAQQRLLQEEGILQVARGVTSIAELMRVLKQ